MYRIITDIESVEELATELEKKLEASFTQMEQRKVNWPRGKARDDRPDQPEPMVRFQRSSTSPARAWSPKREPLKFRNFLLFGEPGSAESMNIAVQVNFPQGKFRMNNGGVFLEGPNKEIWIGHTGKMTRVTQLKREPILRRFDALKMTVTAVGEGDRKQEIIRVAKLRGNSTIRDLWEFAARAREIAESAHREREAASAGNAGRSQPSGAPATGITPKPSKRQQAVLGKLKKYIKEHSGRGARKAVAAGVVNVEHGAIVDALAQQMGKGMTVTNSRFVDLAVAQERGIDLFEVKTSVDTQPLYTAVGQLIVHSVAVGRDTKLQVRRNLVVPKPPRSPFDSIIREDVVARLITYRKVKSGYVFDGLDVEDWPGWS